MRVIPAIDIRRGKCVRLRNGDYSRETIFSDNPAEVAERWAKEGATELHVVDLDAAAGSGSNRPAIAELIGCTGLPVQVGGGVRSEADAEFLFSLGAARIIIGTMLFENPELVRTLCRKYGSSKILAAVDSEAGMIRVQGWTQGTALSLGQGAKLAERAGTGGIIYTSISQDGTLGGPDADGLRALVNSVLIPVIAAGGISSCEDLRAVQDAGADAAILGMALYAGKISLREALKCSQKE